MDGEPPFGWVTDAIVSEEQKIILEVIRCSIVCYSNHYHSWVLEKTTQKSCLLWSDFTTQQVLILRHSNIDTFYHNKICCTMRHAKLKSLHLICIMKYYNKWSIQGTVVLLIVLLHNGLLSTLKYIIL